MTEADFPAPSSGVPAVWGEIPPRNKNFTGREAILARLQRGASSKVTAVLPSEESAPAPKRTEEPTPRALRGWGGVGKTAVAVEYAHRFRSEYDVVWWIPAEQPSLVRASLAQLAARLGLDEATSTGIEGAAAAALDALRRGKPYDRWLLIFDNADRPDDFREYIPSGSVPGDVLITSRNPAWQATADTVQVDVFSREESAEFLGRRASINPEAAETDLLADKLGDLPLALEQAGAMLYETGMPVSEYVGLLEEQIVRIMSEGGSAEYPHSVTAAWRLSVDKVQKQQPEALKLLRCCAFFGPDPIPREVFHSGSRAGGTSVSEMMTDAILLAGAIRVLGRFALVNISEGTITVHRLIQALLRGDLNDEEQDRYRHDVHMILAASAPEDPSDDRQWQRYRELLPHVTSAATDLAQCRDRQVRDFVLKMMRYLYLSGDHSSFEQMTSEFIDKWSADSGQDDPAVLGAKRHLSDMLRQRGRYTEAYEVTGAAVEAASERFGDEDRLTLMLRNSFGGDLRARGDFAGALRLDEKTRAQLRKYRQDDPQVLRIINNLAVDYGLNSSYDKSREFSQLAYQLMRESGGVSATELLVSWYNLSWAVRLQGRYSESRYVSEEALDFGMRRLGPDHYATLRTKIGLSIALRRLTPTREEALQAAMETHETCLRRFGESNPDTMAAAINLTNVQRVNGQLAEALALAQATVAKYPDVYGPDHPYNHGCAGNLALLLRVTGDPSAARDLDEKALGSLTADLGRDHVFSLVVATNLASDHATLHNAHAARALGDDTLSRLTTLLGKTHPFTLGCAANLAVDLRADGAADEADCLLEETMRGYEATLGLGHPDAVAAADADRRLDFDFDPPPI